MEATVRTIASSRCLFLDLPPSCIEFCPAHPKYFVVGTYNLEKEEATAVREDGMLDDEDEPEAVRKPQSRNGSLVVFQLVGDAYDISHIQTLSYPSALLDLRFHPHQDKHDVLATVSSTGTLSFFRLLPSERSSTPLIKLITHKPLGNDENVLFLSCAWHPNLPYLLAVTTSDYQVHILNIDDAWNAHQISSSPVITHTLEAWTVAFSPCLINSVDAISDIKPGDSRGFALYSGGDDSKLLTTTCFYKEELGDDAESNSDAMTAPYPIVAIKGHTAGVTAILPLSLTLVDGSGVLVTGSYDDCIRVYSIHSQIGGVMIRPPQLLTEENLGGGVWRLKLVNLEKPSIETTGSQVQWSALILASCMYAGTRILELRGDYSGSCQISILGRFEEHKSMNYGSDFQPGTEHGGGTLHCVSTSFYDQLLCLWEFDLGK
ncbi:WD40-repeat-containing domain protein [Xylaria bambusicola]|uniref:WD40-repeat-containing domain protein n=1 Tax=Xylaria bambusicola TaxID=326684 RepID=UPI0020079F76|nr:WD40-repeat-containing domain protein [Xylaria bambusicola]KAI0517713.1 WD40-repeat-containing domain protein [Xylaria bambusicola]